VPIGTILVVVIVGGLLWLQFNQDSTAGREVKQAIADAKGAVVKASTDPDLKRAEVFYDDQYTATGSYPNLTDTQLHNGSGTDFGVGVSVLWCSPRAVVLQSMTGTGALSRLLVGGASFGDLLGSRQCPADPTNPLPWTRSGSGNA
jgi:hypothetical protein